MSEENYVTKKDVLNILFAYGEVAAITGNNWHVKVYREMDRALKAEYKDRKTFEAVPEETKMTENISKIYRKFKASIKKEEAAKESLRAFEYIKEKNLPAGLLEVSKKGVGCPVIRDEKLEKVLSLHKAYAFYEDMELYNHLKKTAGYDDEKKIIALKIETKQPKETRAVYYDAKTGERLGDELGMNDWLLKSDEN